MKILIPIDSRPHSQQSIDLVIRLLDLSKCQINLLSISETAHEKLLSHISKALVDAGAKVTISVQKGEPGAIIRAEAERTKADMVVTAPGKHSPRDIMLHGTITSQLLNFDWQGILVLARSRTHSGKKPGNVIFFLNGSSASAKDYLESPQFLAPIILPGVKLWAVTTDHLTKNTFRKSRKEFQMVHSDKPMEEWLSAFSKENPVDLIVLTRTRKDLLNRPLIKSPTDKMFLRSHCSSALFTHRLDTSH